MTKISAWSEYCKSLTPAVIGACQKAPVASGPGGLLKELNQALPDWAFRHVFCRGGWYRLGGVVNTQGERVASDLEAWLESELDERGDDFSALAEDFEQAGLFATRLVGRTHYLVASCGDSCGDFLQLELEELQEVLSHPLFEAGEVPSSLEDIVDPRHGAPLGKPVAMPQYVFRRLSHIGSVLARMQASQPDTIPLRRLFLDWERSSAGSTSEFRNHWVLALREHLDRYQQTQIRAQPIATVSGGVPELDISQDCNGLDLHTALSAFDRAIGYPFAWFFHMVSGKVVPKWIAQSVVEDSLSGFAYLPQKDVDVVRDWLHRPYVI